MVRWDRKRWSNWLGDVVIEHPQRHWYPTGCTDLVAIVAQAGQQDPPPQVRVCGSHWALSDIAATPDWIVETTGMRRSLTDVVPHALSTAARRTLEEHPHGSGLGIDYKHVECGITVRELADRLDAEPGRRWALPTMGGAAGQTIAGAVATGVHGGDHELPPMADHVVALHLVTAAGRQLWIEPNDGDPLTDPALLAAALPGVEQVRSTQVFQAALVAVGRMGIVYSLVLRVVEQFGLDQIIVASTWEEQRRGLLAPYAVFAPDGRDPTRFIEVVMPPYAVRDGAHPCYVTRRWRTPDDARPAPPRRDFFGLVCSHRTLKPVERVAAGAGVGLLIVTVPVAAVTGWGWLAVGGEAAVTAGLLAAMPWSRRTTIGGLVAGLCNLANRARQSWLVRWLGGVVLSAGRPRTRVHDVAHHVMDLGRAGTSECYRGDAMEVAFDAASGAHVTFVDQNVFPTFNAADAKRRAVAGYVSLRFTRRSVATLAMQRWDRTCHVEIGLLQGLDGNAEILDALRDAALARGGTVHWGERNTLDRTAVERAFPQVGPWRRVLARVLGPTGDVFGNGFCTRHGLDPEP